MPDNEGSLGRQDNSRWSIVKRRVEGFLSRKPQPPPPSSNPLPQEAALEASPAQSSSEMPPPVGGSDSIVSPTASPARPFVFEGDEEEEVSNRPHLEGDEWPEATKKEIERAFKKYIKKILQGVRMDERKVDSRRQFLAYIEHSNTDPSSRIFGILPVDYAYRRYMARSLRKGEFVEVGRAEFSKDNPEEPQAKYVPFLVEKTDSAGIGRGTVVKYRGEEGIL